MAERVFIRELASVPRYHDDLLLPPPTRPASAVLSSRRGTEGYEAEYFLNTCATAVCRISENIAAVLIAAEYKNTETDH